MATEEQLIKFYKSKAEWSSVAAFCWFLINTLIHIVVTISIGRIAINPLHDLIYYDFNLWNISIFSLEALIMIMILYDEAVAKNYLECFARFAVINTGCYHSPLCIFCIIYGKAWYHSFQSIIYQFIRKKTNDKDKKIGYIAIHHYLSAFIVKTKNENTNWHYDLSKMDNVCKINKYLNELYASPNQFETVEALRTVDKTPEDFSIPAVIFGLFIMTLPNISMIRLLFWSGTNLTIYQWPALLFLGKWLFEIIVIISILNWIRCNMKAWIINTRCNDGSEGRLIQFNEYYEMIRSLNTLTDKQWDMIEIAFNNEMMRYYELWNDKYQRPNVKKMLSQQFCDDVAALICVYTFGELGQRIELKYMLGSNVKKYN